MASDTNGVAARFCGAILGKFFPDLQRKREEDEAIGAWVAAGRPARPPHAVKSRAIKEYAARFSIRVLVETGTYQGEMVESCKRAFARVYSIELSEELHAKAKLRFATDSNVRLLQGDSSNVLPRVLAELEGPCLFWLDAHYSGGNTAQGKVMTPIFDELACILEHDVQQHVILIDDASDFMGIEGYPTLAELKAFVLDRKPGWTFESRDDIVRIHA